MPRGQVRCLGVTTLPREKAHRDAQDDFFSSDVHLTVSGQLEAEMLMMGLGRVYTFGPTFRAENSNTPRHLAEFWMVEPEMAFYDLHDNIACAEELVKGVLKSLLESSEEDLHLLNLRYKEEHKGQHLRQDLIGRIERVVTQPFVHLSYTEAFDVLRKSKAQKKGKFVYPVEKWGMDLQTEHERYLVQKHDDIPVVVRDYPRDTKAFYMRQNEDGRTVAAMDMLFPELGEMIGGSQREERLSHLQNRVRELKLSEPKLADYLKTRRFGTMPHSGFGLGFERLVQFATGMHNIRDVIPFPRYPVRQAENKL